MRKVDVYEVTIQDDAEREIKKLVRNKKFYSLPNQIFDLADEFEKGNFEGDIILS